MHASRIFDFGQNLPKLTKMHQSRLKFSLRWNKGVSHSGLQTNMRYSIHSGQNGMEFITLLQNYEMGLPSHKFGKSIALKQVEELKSSNSDETDIEKEVAYLVKCFKKILKFKKNSRIHDKNPSKKSFDSRREFQGDDGKKDYKWKKSSEESSNSTTKCYECNGVGSLKKEYPNYLRGKENVISATLCDLESSLSKFDDDANENGNYTAIMAISRKLPIQRITP